MASPSLGAARRPKIVAGVRAGRYFLARPVRYLASQCGIPPFLHIGTRLPAPGNTHDVTQEITPGCQVAYVANDPLLLACARALLVSRTSLHTPQGQVITLSRRGNAIIMTSPACPPVPGQALVRTSPAVSASPRRKGRIPRD
jgi:hypothetical protein